MYDVHNYYFKVQFSAYHGLFFCTVLLFIYFKKRASRDAVAKENAWKEVSNQVHLSYYLRRLQDS